MKQIALCLVALLYTVTAQASLIQEARAPYPPKPMHTRSTKRPKPCKSDEVRVLNSITGDIECAPTEYPLTNTILDEICGWDGYEFRCVNLYLSIDGSVRWRLLPEKNDAFNPDKK